MEYGLIPNIDQFKSNHSLEIQKIQSSKASSKLDEGTQLEDVQENELIKLRESFDTKEVSNDVASAPQFEVTLTNMNFGFNDSSRDFFVRATRGAAENQYPTEEMMKLKSYLMDLDQSA